MSREQLLKSMLRRALKNHDAICAALRTGLNSPRNLSAIDDMKELKKEASEIGCYKPAPVPMRHLS